MGVYADQILPRITDLAPRGKPIDELRRQATADLDGEDLEVRSAPAAASPTTRAPSIGSVPWTPPRRPQARRRTGCGQRRTRRVRRPRRPAAPPLDDARVDHVLTTW